MSLHAILKVILASGDAKVGGIDKRANAQAHEILANARLNASKIKEEARAEAIAPAIRERSRIIHHSRLLCLQIIGNVRETQADAALDQTRGRLAGFRTDTAYPEVLRRLTEEALAEFEETMEDVSRVQLEADQRDTNLLDGILRDLDFDGAVSYDLDCWGGLIVRSDDKRIVVINTLEARLERATHYLRHYLASISEVERPVSEESPVLEIGID